MDTTHIDAHCLEVWFAVARARIERRPIDADDRAYQVALFYRRLFK